MDISQQLLFYIYMNNFSRKEVRLPKYIVIALTAEPPMVIHNICTEPRWGSLLRTLEEDSKVHLVPGENATSGISIADDVAAIQ